MSGQIAGLAPFDNDPLHERRAAAVCLQLDHAGEKIRRSRHPANPEARCDQFRKRAEMQHVLVPIQCLQTGLGGALKANLPIGTILDDIHAVPRCELEQRFAPASWHRDASRIVEIRNVIDEFRHLPPIPLQPLQGRRELVGVEPFVVLPYLNEVDLEAPKDWDIQKESFDAKEGKCINSDFLNGLDVKDSIKRAIKEIETKNLGKGKSRARFSPELHPRDRARSLHRADGR